MLIEFVYGPKKDTREHTSRDIGAALIVAGLAVEVPKPPDPIRAPAPRGWSLVRKVNEQAQELLLFVFADGMGGQTLYDKIPGPRKVWRYHAETGAEGYEFEPTDCPAELIAQFRAMGGGSANPFADLDAGAAHQQRLVDLEAQQDSQNNLANTYLRVHGVKP